MIRNFVRTNFEKKEMFFLKWSSQCLAQCYLLVLPCPLSAFIILIKLRNKKSNTCTCSIWIPVSDSNTSDNGVLFLYTVSAERNWHKVLSTIQWKTMEFEVKGKGKQGRPKKMWKMQLEKESKSVGLEKEDVMNRARWRVGVGEIAVRVG